MTDSNSEQSIMTTYLKMLEKAQNQIYSDLAREFNSLHLYASSPFEYYKSENGEIVEDDDSVKNIHKKQKHIFQSPADAWVSFWQVVNSGNASATGVRLFNDGGVYGFEFYSKPLGEGYNNV